MLISLNPNAASMSNADEHDEDEPVQLTILPDPESQGTEAAKIMFKALSDCQSLHPDPEQSDDEDGDPIVFEGDAEMRLEGFPTGGGWITAENVDQFRFEDAEEENRAQSGTILGPGAGAVRRREEEDENTETTGSADSDTKWRRTG